jgi:uncharacterized protein (TIGR03067 family)
MMGEAHTTEDKQIMGELDGVWVCESGTVNGRKLDDETANSLKLTLNGEQFKTERGDQVLFDSTYSVDVNANPPHINMVGIGELAGRIGEGIFELNGDRLTMCYTMPGHDRPQTFVSEDGSNVHLMVWRRAE